MDKLFNSFLNGSVDIFNEIRKFRGTSCLMSSSVDGRVGSHDHFASVYMALYQLHTLGAGLDEMNRQFKIDQNILGTLDSQL